jgi:hypothetical protein
MTIEMDENRMVMKGKYNTMSVDFEMKARLIIFERSRG